jgi:hypothetical protein
MKKWFLIIGLFLSGSLFFISGILTGYSMYAKGIRDPAKDGGKPVRRPRILTEIADPLIGRIIDNRANSIGSRIDRLRAPSDQAVQQAEQYKSRIE